MLYRNSGQIPSFPAAFPNFIAASISLLVNDPNHWDNGAHVAITCWNWWWICLWFCLSTRRFDVHKHLVMITLAFTSGLVAHGGFAACRCLSLSWFQMRLPKRVMVSPTHIQTTISAMLHPVTPGGLFQFLGLYACHICEGAFGSLQSSKEHMMARAPRNAVLCRGD